MASPNGAPAWLAHSETRSSATRFLGDLRRAAALAVALLLAFLAPPLPAQIYDDIDLGKWNKPNEIFSKYNYVTPEMLEAFEAGDYDLRRFADKYQERLEKTLEPNRASQSGDVGFQIQLAAAYLWTGQTPKALEVLEPLSEKSPADIGPLAPTVFLNLAEAYERAGLYLKAIDAAKRAQALAGKRLGQPEDARLLRLEYKRHAESDPVWASDNMGEPVYTFGWRNKRLPPIAFRDFNPPNGIDPEMRKQIYSIRASPDYADAWLSLAMLVEKRSNKTTMVTCYRMYRRAVELNHPMADKIKVHLRALDPFLPAGFSFASAAWITLKKIVGILIIGFGLVYASRFTGKTSWKGWEKLRAKLAARRERRWRPDRWEDHHLETLERELDDRLDDGEAPRGGKGAAGKNGKPGAGKTGPGSNGKGARG